MDFFFFFLISLSATVLHDICNFSLLTEVGEFSYKACPHCGEGHPQGLWYRAPWGDKESPEMRLASPVATSLEHSSLWRLDDIAPWPTFHCEDRGGLPGFFVKDDPHMDLAHEHPREEWEKTVSRRTLLHDELIFSCSTRHMVIENQSSLTLVLFKCRYAAVILKVLSIIIWGHLMLWKYLAESNYKAIQCVAEITHLKTLIS